MSFGVLLAKLVLICCGLLHLIQSSKHFPGLLIENMLLLLAKGLDIHREIQVLLHRQGVMQVAVLYMLLLYI